MRAVCVCVCACPSSNRPVNPCRWKCAWRWGLHGYACCVCMCVWMHALAAIGLQILVDGKVPEGEGCTVLHAVCVCVCACVYVCMCVCACPSSDRPVILVDGNVPEGEGCTVLHAAAAERWNWHFKRRCSSASRACNSLWMRRCAWKCEMHGSACCNCWSYKLALQKVLRFTKLGLQFLMDEKVCLELWIARFCMLQLLKLKMVLQKALRFTNSGLQFLVDE